MNKKIIIGLLILFGGLLAVDPLGLGVNNLANSDGQYFSFNLFRGGDTVRTWVYNYFVRNTEGVMTLRLAIDSMRTDSVKASLFLVEGWDYEDFEATDEFITLIGTIEGLRDIDTTFTVNLYPLPFFRFWIVGTTGIDDTMMVNKLQLFITPR